MTEKRISFSLPNCNRKRKPRPLSSFGASLASSWIIGLAAIIVLSNLCVSVNSLPYPAKAWRKVFRQQQHRLSQDGYDFTDPDARIDTGASFRTIALDNKMNTNDIGNQNAYVREPRAAPNIRHYDRIPATKSQAASLRRGTSPPQEENDEDDYESLEANREAFIEILADHAKHPHRHRSNKHHNSKLHLKYDFEAKRYALTEEQSEEW